MLFGSAKAMRPCFPISTLNWPLESLSHASKSRAIFTEEVGKDPKKLQETIHKFTLDVIAHMDLPKSKPQQ